MPAFRRRPFATAPVAAIQILERRTLFSVELAPNGIVTLTGTDGPDLVVVSLNPSNPDHLQLRAPGAFWTFPLRSLEGLRIDCGGGDDVLTIDNASGMVGRGAGLSIQFEGGGDGDQLVLQGGGPGSGFIESLTPGPLPDGGELVCQSADAAVTILFSGVEVVVTTPVEPVPGDPGEIPVDPGEIPPDPGEPPPVGALFAPPGAVGGNDWEEDRSSDLLELLISSESI